MTKQVYQLEGQQLRGLLLRARMTRLGLTGARSVSTLLVLYEAIRDVTQIEDLLTMYLERPTVEADD